MASKNIKTLQAQEYADLDPRLREMLEEIRKFRDEIRPSKYWEFLK